MKYLSCFSGIGGFELGIIHAYDSLYSGPTMKIEKEAKATLDMSDTTSEHTLKSTSCRTPYEQMMRSANSQEKVQGTRDKDGQPLECTHIGTEGLFSLNNTNEQIHNLVMTSSTSNSEVGRHLPLSYSSNGAMMRTDTSVPVCVGFSEIDKYATQIYQSHFPNHPEYGDITKINAEELPDFDCLVGGFPCQAFSIAGKRKGFEDTRGTLFFELARIAKAKKPMFLLFENVKGLVSHDNGNTLETILCTLQELGYYVNIEIRNSKDHGVPQNRERIFFLCKNIKILSSVGQTQKMTTSEQTIQEWLFQILLNNLKEAEKLQGQESKDSILGYLICKEIKENPLFQDTRENIFDGISIVTEGKLSQLVGNPWQSIDTYLKKTSGVNGQELNKSTILTAINSITNSETFTYSQMVTAILLATALLRNSSSHLWTEVLLSLTLIKESTNYERINNKNEEAVITESGTLHLLSELQEFSRYFVVQHLRGTSRHKVFPFGGTSEKNIQQLNQPKHSNDRVYGTEGVSPTLNTMQGGNRQPFVSNSPRIRRLTPVECERLQGFPDNWTECVSDTQRYKCCGNAVTTNVVRDIFISILGTDPAQHAEVQSSSQSENMRSTTSASGSTPE